VASKYAEGNELTICECKAEVKGEEQDNKEDKE